MQSLNAKFKKLLSIHRYFKGKFTIFDLKKFMHLTLWIVHFLPVIVCSGDNQRICIPLFLDTHYLYKLLVVILCHFIFFVILFGDEFSWCFYLSIFFIFFNPLTACILYMAFLILAFSEVKGSFLSFNDLAQGMVEGVCVWLAG